MAASVLWQNHLTFGLLQHHLRAVLNGPATVLVVAALFALGHMLFLPDRFGTGNPLALLAMVALGAVLAALRERTGSVHLGIALQLAFYLVAA